MSLSGGRLERSTPARSQISVRVPPGSTACTLTPRSPTSACSACVKFRTKALVPL